MLFRDTLGGVTLSIEAELANLVNKEIAITMTDGLIYRGILSKYDKETIVLMDVYEASNKDVDWIETSYKDKKGKKVKSVKGFIQWRKIMLPKAYIRTKWILRLWPWEV